MFRASFSLKACAAARVFEEGASRLAKGRKENGRARTDSLARAKKKRERRRRRGRGEASEGKKTGLRRIESNYRGEGEKGGFTFPSIGYED